MESGDVDASQEQQDGSIQESAATTKESVDGDRQGEAEEEREDGKDQEGNDVPRHFEIDVEKLKIDALKQEWMNEFKNLKEKELELQTVVLGCQLDESDQTPEKIDCLWLTVLAISKHDEIDVDEVVKRMEKIHNMDEEKRNNHRGHGKDGQPIRGIFPSSFPIRTSKRSGEIPY